MSSDFNVSQVFEVESLAETLALASRFAELLNPGDIVLLEGELGVGKTEFVRGIARSLGVVETVQSPTFVIEHIYPVPLISSDAEQVLSERAAQRGILELIHVDLYRVTAGTFDESLLSFNATRSVVFIEWGSRLPHLRDLASWEVRMSILTQNRSETEDGERRAVEILRR